MKRWIAMLLALLLAMTATFGALAEGEVILEEIQADETAEEFFEEYEEELPVEEVEEFILGDEADDTGLEEVGDEGDGEETFEPVVEAEQTDALEACNAGDGDEQVISGTCGYNNARNVTWTLVNGVATISGTGRMNDSRAFYDGEVDYSEQVTSIIIESGVTNIGCNAFTGCANLTSVTIPNTVEYIDGWAFSGCISLTSIVIPEGVYSLGKYAFSGCSGLTDVSLPESLTHLQDFVFDGCTSLTSLTLPGNLESITNVTFYSKNNALYTVTPEILYAPADSATARVLSGRDFPFREINGGYENYKVRYVYDENGTKLGRELRNVDEGVTTFVCPDDIVVIGQTAFSGCANLESVTIPAGVTSIGGFAFSGCNNLESVTIPAGVTSIGDQAFSGCTSLKSVSFMGGLETIGKYAFSGCTSLTEVVLPDSVTTIGSSAFDSCKSLSNLELSDNLQSVGSYIISGCDSLTELRLPDNIKESEWQSAFDNGWTTTLYANLNTTTAKTLGDHKKTFRTMDGVFSVVPYPGGHMALFGINTDATSVEIPEGIHGFETYPVSFSMSDTIKNLTLPESVSSIWDYTFYNKSSLERLVIPASVTEISDKAILYCPNLTIVTPCKSTACQYAQDKGIPCEATHNWNAPTYTWAEDNSSVTASHTCVEDAGHVETETVKTTASVSREETCSAAGETTYTATFTKHGFVAQSRSVDDISARHAMGTPVYGWADDFGQVTATCACTRCDYKETETVNTTSKVTRAATCSAKGETTFTADFENELFEQQNKAVENIDINPSAHAPVDDAAVAATCVKAGKTAGKHCKLCGEVITAQKEVSATGVHTWSAWKTAKAATCTAAGTQERTCSVCGKKETGTIAATSHKPVTVKGKAATCTATGLTDGKQCSVCKAWITPQKTIVARGHKAVTVKGKAATCTATGLTDGTKCSACGTWIKAQQTIAKKAHTPTTVKGYAATYVKAGLSDGTKCSVCGTTLKAQTAIARKTYPGSVLAKKGKNGTITVNLGEQFMLTPAFATSAGLTVKGYKSSKTKVAAVDGSGIVTAKAEGKATITVTTNNKKKKATVVIKVVDPYKPTGISITNGKKVTLEMGKTLKLNAKMKPDTAQSNLTFKSSKKSVATVDGSGLVKPVKEGTAKITVTTRNKKKATITVKVVDPFKPTGISITNGKTVTIKMNETLKLGTQLEPSTAQSELTWKSANKKIATVDATGTVKALKKGKVKITVTSKKNKKVKATITVKVEP